MNLTLWRGTSVRGEWLREMLQQKPGREMLAVLQSQMPVPLCSTMEKTALAGAETAGYARCLAVLRLMAEETKPKKEEVEVDYGGKPDDTSD